jgi:hypothetical protein
MITPTIGRQVWFVHKGKYTHARALGPIFAATITHVWSDHCINIAAIDSDGMVFGVTSVELCQETLAPPHPHCVWMPYQKGQAAKVDEMERDIRAAADPRLHERPR